MNTNVGAKRVLFYGDSLVYGKASGVNKRLDVNVRFTGLIQSELGSEYEIIEEGLRARTLSGENSFFPERNGLEQFAPILGSHLPIDLLVIALGTNDANAGNQPNPETIISALDQYLGKLVDWCEFLAINPPKLLFVIPPNINTDHFDDPMAKIFGNEAPQKLQLIQDTLKKYCLDNSHVYVDSAVICEPAAGDGIHLDESGNSKLASALVEKIKLLMG